MGASASSLPIEPNRPGPLTRPKLEDIPESCIALVLSHLDPPEIAKLARLNRAFRAASSADFIWVPKLPSNYPYILALLSDQGLGDKGKKDIYARLCRPTPFDGGTKEVWIDKRTGGVCLAISSKALVITGIDDRRYWNHIPTNESRENYCHLEIWRNYENPPLVLISNDCVSTTNMVAASRRRPRFLLPDRNLQPLLPITARKSREEVIRAACV
ncbi:hypothetical protein ABFS82_14G143400 [Erythranthe guttata]